MSPEDQERVLNGDLPEGARAVSLCVPTRAFRVIAMPGDKTFRVQQLDPSSWKWLTRSTHTGDKIFEAFVPALLDASQKQEELKKKITEAQIAQRNAERLVEQG